MKNMINITARPIRALSEFLTFNTVKIKPAINIAAAHAIVSTMAEYKPKLKMEVSICFDSLKALNSSALENAVAKKITVSKAPNPKAINCPYLDKKLYIGFSCFLF